MQAVGGRVSAVKLELHCFDLLWICRTAQQIGAMEFEHIEAAYKVKTPTWLIDRPSERRTNDQVSKIGR